MTWMTNGGRSKLGLVLLAMLGSSLLPQILIPAVAEAQKQSCSTPGSWSAQETWIYEQLCSDGYADLDDYDTSASPVPEATKGWTEDRQVSPDFLIQILTDDKYTSQLKRPYLVIEGMWVRAPLNLSDLTVTPSFSFRSSRFEESVSFARAVTGGDIGFSGSTFVDDLSLAEADVAGDVFLQEGVHVRNLDMSFIQVQGSAILSGLAATGSLNLSKSSVGGSVFVEDRVALSEVNLSFSEIEGSLNLGGTFKKNLNMSSVQVSQNLQFDDNSTVAGVTTIDWSTVGGVLGLDRSTFSNEVSLFGAKLGRVFVQHSSLLGDLDCRSVTVAGGLSLGGSTLHGDVWCSAAKIDGVLALTQDEDTRWADKSMLDLSAATVGGINDSEKAWPMQVALQGFTYGSGASERMVREGKEATPLLERKSSWYVDWLSRSEYSRQPYKEMELALRAVGNKKAADDVAVAGEDRSREGSWNPVSWLYKYTVQYGYRPLQALIPAILLVLAGVYALSKVTYDKNEIPSKTMLSIQRLIPLVTLGDNYSKFDLTTGAVPKGVRRYFYFHSFCGYVLAGFLIAGLTRITTVG